MTRTLPSYRGQVSASRLETYARCPYLYFLKHGMDLEAWEEPDSLEDIDPLQRGLAVHEVLERFLKERGKAAFDAPVEDPRQTLSSLAGDILERYRPYTVAELLWEIERDNLLALLGQWVEFEKGRTAEGLFPERLEQVFGEFPEEDPFPVFRVRTENHCFDFRGRIDRIDLSRDGRRARVIDYKTGARPQAMASRSRPLLMGGERMQIAVYRGALSVLEAFQSVESVEGEYLFLQPRDRRVVASAFSAEELERAPGLLAEILEILGDSLDSGVFFARTGGTVRPYGHCDYCDYLTICGKDRVQREERKAADPRVQRFMRITANSGT
jgi:RecB family exonuclease